MGPDSPEPEVEVEEEAPTPAHPAEETPFEFEERFRRLLHTMGLTDIDGGPTFSLGGHQVDACGGIEKHLIVFDCTIRKGTKATTKRLRGKIEQWRGKFNTLRDAARSHPIYSKYDHLTVAIAANASVADVDMEYGKGGSPTVAILSRQNLEYLSEIADDLGPYTRFRLASLLGMRIPRHPQSVPAIRVKDRDKDTYLFAVDAKTVAELAFVPQAEAGFKLFYQRLVKKAKITAISEYVQQNTRPFPNSVILATNTPPRFQDEDPRDQTRVGDLPRVGVMSLPEDYGSCWVVDGQHRIYGSALSARNTNLVVTLINASDLEKARYFLDINSNQTKIDSDLKWDLRARLMPDDPEGRISRAIQLLDELDGPLKGKLRIPHKGVGRGRSIKLSGLCDAVLRNRLHEAIQYNWEQLGYEKNLSTDLNGWFREIDAKVEDPGIKRAFLFENSGLSVLVIIFKRISKRLEHVRPNLVRLMIYAQALANWISQLDQSEAGKLATRCSSEAGRSEVADRAVASMNENLPADSLLELSGKATRLSEEVVTFEAQVRARLDEVCRAPLGPDWVAKAAVGGPGRPINEVQQLGLGHMFTLLHRDVFWKLVERGFQKCQVRQELGLSLFQYVTDYRNAHQHGKLQEARKFDDAFAENALRTLRRCLDIL
jgi:DGQHR domain-containing protein